MRFNRHYRSNPRIQSLKEAGGLLDSMQAARRNVIRAINIALICIGCVGLYVLASVLWELRKVPDLVFLEHYQPVGNIRFYDRNDNLICDIEGTERRKIIPISQVTNHVQRAVLAAEDHHFYEHHGVDPFGILRAAVVNIVARHTVQGGSTITQQLAKNLFFEDSKRSLPTKIAEAVVANQLENKFTKEKILELYLNEVYFGNGAYGIEQAANLYFNKDASDLTIAESAYLAGLIRWPSRGGQAQFARENIARQHDVIDKMLEYGYIFNAQADAAKMQPLFFQSRPQRPISHRPPKYPYYISYVLDLTREMFTEGQMQRHGLKVYTNLDPAAQEAAERVIANGIKHAPSGVNQGALVSVNVRDGAVVALVGGAGDYLKNQYNCATGPHTVGSSFKPFVYLATFIRGSLNPASLIADEPIDIPQEHEPDYKPKNFDGKYYGQITVTEALALSRNTCAIRAAQIVGIDSVISTAQKAGIKSPIPRQISAALGCGAASPLEMAAAYSTLARGGVYIQPSVIRHIDDRNGNALRAFYHGPQTVFETAPVAQIVDVLQEVVAQGTGIQAKLSDRPVAGKTGTSDQAKDLWFVGFTPDLVTAVWGGNQDNKPIPGSHTTGGTVMAGIWREYNRAYYAKHDVPKSWFIACTHLAGGFKFSTHEAVKEEQAKPALHVAPPVVPYEVIDPASKVYTRPVGVIRRAENHPSSGVTEYRWRTR